MKSLSILDYLEKRKRVHEDMKAHGITDYEHIKKERDELSRQVKELKEAQNLAIPAVEAHEETPKPAKKSYDELVQEIIDNHQDSHHIYDRLDAITTDYPNLLKKRYSTLFDKFYEQAFFQYTLCLGITRKDHIMPSKTQN